MTVKGLLAAALLAALAGGAWWFVNARAARSTGTTGVPPVVTAADVAGIAVEATVQKARIERLDDADGFKARKDSLAAAAKQFDLCVDEAKAERKRQEEARERAMSIEAEIVRDIEPELKRFKAEDCVKDTLADGNNLRKEGNAALSRGDFPEAEGKLIQAKEKLAAAAKDAKACRVAASLRRAREHSVTSRWQQCIDECDKVLGWDPANTEAKDLKSRAEVSDSSSQRQPVTAYTGPHYEYIVEKGQTLSLIAEGFGTTVSKILAANPGLSQGGLRIGQKLIIPAE